MFFTIRVNTIISTVVLTCLFQGRGSPVRGATRLAGMASCIPSTLLINILILLVNTSFVPGGPTVAGNLVYYMLLIVNLICGLVGGGHVSTIARPLGAVSFSAVNVLLKLFLVVNNVSRGKIVSTTTGFLTGANKGGVFLLCAVVI